MADAQYDLSAKLGRLMAAAGNPSTERLAEQIRTHTGTGISGAYLWQIKRGKRANLTLQHLTALASFFSDTLGVRITLSYFDPATPVDKPWTDAQDGAAPDSNGADSGAADSGAADSGRADPGGAEPAADEPGDADDLDGRAFADAMRDRGVRQIAARYGSMDPIQRKQLLAIADAIASVRDDGSDGADESVKPDGPV